MAVNDRFEVAQAALQVVAGVEQEHVVVIRQRNVLDAHNDLVIERVADVRDQQPDCVCALRDQAPGDQARAVVHLFDCAQNPLACVVPDKARIVDHV